MTTPSAIELEPLSTTSVALGAVLPRPALDVVHEYAKALPIEGGGHAIQTGKRTYRAYWVSGSSLVIVDTEEIEHDSEQGRWSTGAHGSVLSLKSARVEIEVSGLTEPQAGPDDWRWQRTLKLGLQGHPEPITLPDPKSLPLDNKGKRDQVNALLDAVLKVVAQG
ncbi:MAG: hypothetical protein HYZ38_27600 [Mycobacterium sp.]|nr:hypothetical protein [Mycobacterium sp.]